MYRPKNNNKKRFDGQDCQILSSYSFQFCHLFNLLYFLLLFNLRCHLTSFSLQIASDNFLCSLSSASGQYMHLTFLLIEFALCGSTQAFMLFSTKLLLIGIWKREIEANAEAQHQQPCTPAVSFLFLSFILEEQGSIYMQHNIFRNLILQVEYGCDLSAGCPNKT